MSMSRNRFDRKITRVLAEVLNAEWMVRFHLETRGGKHRKDTSRCLFQATKVSPGLPAFPPETPRSGYLKEPGGNLPRLPGVSVPLDEWCGGSMRDAIFIPLMGH